MNKPQHNVLKYCHHHMQHLFSQIGWWKLTHSSASSQLFAFWGPGEKVHGKYRDVTN